MDGARGGFVQPLEESGDGGFARTGSADDGDTFAGLDVERDTREHFELWSGGVGEVDVREGNLAGDLGSKVPSVFWSRSFGTGD